MAQTNAHILPPITKSWHDAWATFRGRFWIFVGLAVLPQLVTTGAIYLISTVVLGDVRASGLLAETLSPTNVILYVIIAAAILLFVLQIFAAVALVVAAKQHGQIGLMQAFDEARHYVIPFFLTSVLNTILSLVALVVGYIIVAILTALLVAVHLPNTATWFDWLSIIPYVLSLLVLAKFIFAGISVVVEKKGALAALRRSSDVLKGVYWHVVLRLLLMYAILFIIIFAAGYIPYVGGLLAAALAIPFGVLYLFTIFEELRTARA